MTLKIENTSNYKQTSSDLRNLIDGKMGTGITKRRTVQSKSETNLKFCVAKDMNTNNEIRVVIKKKTLGLLNLNRFLPDSLQIFNEHIKSINCRYIVLQKYIRNYQDNKHQLQKVSLFIDKKKELLNVILFCVSHIFRQMRFVIEIAAVVLLIKRRNDISTYLCEETVISIKSTAVGSRTRVLT